MARARAHRGTRLGECRPAAGPARPRRGAARRDSVARLAPVEVVGSILPAAGPAVGSGVPARAATVTGGEIDRWGPRLLADALARQPGVSLYDDLGSPYKVTLQSRGFTAGPVVGLPQGLSVFLDGVPVNEPDAAQVNFDLLPLGHVRRVELLSGTSSLLGPNSLGGAVNLVTRRGDGPARGAVELSAGSYGLRSAEASVGGGDRGWSYYAGGRYDRVRVPFRNRLRPARDTTSTFARLSPKGGVSLAFGAPARGRGGSLYASLGRSFRAPAVIELACADPREPCPLPFALGDDPPLAPVVATTGEVGGRYAVGPLALSASAYRTNVRDDIFLLPYDGEEGGPPGSTVDGYFANVSRTRRQGVELGATARLPRGVAAFANYAFTRATFQTRDVAIFSVRGEAEDGGGPVNRIEPGDQLPLVPAHTLRAGVDAPLPRGAEAGVDVRYTGPQWLRGDEANETRPLAGYAVASVRLGYTAGAWGVRAVVHNAFGARYATFGTFNLNQGNGNQAERFLTPGQPRAVRLLLRRGIGGGGGRDD